MKITDTREKNSVEFEQLNIGDIFRTWGEGYIYLKTKEANIETDDGVWNGLFNAVDLSNNEMLTFAYDELVIPVNAELVLN